MKPHTPSIISSGAAHVHFASCSQTFMAKAWKEERDLAALQLHGKQQTREGFVRGRIVVTLTALLISALEQRVLHFIFSFPILIKT